MKNAEVAKVFQDIADLLELKGEKVFKIRAYQKAAFSLEHLSEEVEELVREERLREVPGVGEAIARKTTELVTTGRLKYYEDLKVEFPPGIGTLLEVPSIGPKTAMLLSKELDIKSFDELEVAITNGKVASLPGMGEKASENILRRIQVLRRKDERIPVGEALTVVDEIIARMRQVLGLKNWFAAICILSPVVQIGFVWLCFFAARVRQNLYKPLMLLILRSFPPLQIGFVFSNCI